MSAKTERSTVRLYRLHQAQKAVRAEARRFNAVACGRRWGKTILAIDLVIETALAGYPAGWFAPEYKLLDDAWREMKAILGPLAQPNEQQKRLVLLNGGTIDAWAFDRNPNAGRSRRYKRVVIDEAAHCTNLEATWTKGIRPTLTDFKGDAWFLSSPKGPNYFKALYDRGQTGEAHWKSWRQSSYTNPKLDPSEIDSARLDVPDPVFRQEYLAEFLDEGEWQLLPASWIDRCASTRRDPNARGGPRALALDISKGTGRDRTVAMVGDNLGLLAIVCSNRIGVFEAAQLAADLSSQWGVPHERIVYDAGGWAGPDMGRYLEALNIMDAIGYRGGLSGGTRFFNRRARSAWKLRQRLDPERPVLLPKRPARDEDDDDDYFAPPRKPSPIAAIQPGFAIPPGEHWDGLRRELIELRYEWDDGEIALEKKSACQARLKHSPDLADTLIMLASLWSDE